MKFLENFDRLDPYASDRADAEFVAPAAEQGPHGRPEEFHHQVPEIDDSIRSPHRSQTRQLDGSGEQRRKLRIRLFHDFEFRFYGECSFCVGICLELDGDRRSPTVHCAVHRTASAFPQNTFDDIHGGFGYDSISRAREPGRGSGHRSPNFLVPETHLTATRVKRSPSYSRVRVGHWRGVVGRYEPAYTHGKERGDQYGPQNSHPFAL